MPLPVVEVEQLKCRDRFARQINPLLGMLVRLFLPSKVRRRLAHSELQISLCSAVLAAPSMQPL